MNFRRHDEPVLLMAILIALNGGCIDLVTESAKEGVSEAISEAVANVIGSMFVVREDM